MEEDEHSPVPPRRAPPMNSPFVPSVARCASAEAEEKRQVAAARCVIQAANVALFISVSRCYAGSSFGPKRAKEGAARAAVGRNSKMRDATLACSSHACTQGFFTRWWRPLWAFQWPC